MAAETVNKILTAEKKAEEAELNAKKEAAVLIEKAKEEALEIISKAKNDAVLKATEITDNAKKAAEAYVAEKEAESLSKAKMLEEYAVQKKDAAIEMIINLVLN